MESTHPFSVSFAPCFQAVLCRSRLFFRMFLDKLFQICADRFIMKQKRRCFSPFLLSPSSRRAWIEIPSVASTAQYAFVALLTEGVDRNTSLADTVLGWFGSPSSRRAWIEMTFSSRRAYARFVALLTEGVDRNTKAMKTQNATERSPSSRRAWIEMFYPRPLLCLYMSPSSRRAWIEIFCCPPFLYCGYVALLTEGVDRNRIVKRGQDYAHHVALLTEGVDRNLRRCNPLPAGSRVALLTEGVDRNVIF